MVIKNGGPGRSVEDGESVICGGSDEGNALGV